MISTELHWVDGPWPGKLALAARPRGSDWLPDEMESWQRSGVDTVLSLLTPDEEQNLNLIEEEREARAHGMRFLSHPIPDRQVPESEVSLGKTLEKLDTELASGRNVVLHCRQGIGRAGLVAACLLVRNGLEAQLVIARLSAARGVEIPETTEQRRWIDQYGSMLST